MINDKLKKNAAVFEELGKSDISLSEALKITRQNNPQAGKVLAKHIYTDSMTGGKIGNYHAYKDFLSRHQNAGIHLSVDGNSFGSINKDHGWEMGNEAIKQLFGAMSEVSRKYGLKLFRTGGDEGRLHASTPERANGFVKELTEKLAQMHKVGGNHQLSVSVGMGYTPEHAEKAMILAKQQLGPILDGKRQKIAKPGLEPSVSHSLLHEPPPQGWRPAQQSLTGGTKKLDFGGMKLANPMKEPK